MFNDWLTRTRADIALLTTDLETGPYPYAGIPWFSTAFGRDGVISALQMLWLNPALARGVLSFLARHQATETSPFSDSEPGKIMHETRKGEMAVLRELPFGRYYGGVDTTPLYVYLAASYADRTGDMAFIDAHVAVALPRQRPGWKRSARATATASSPTSGQPNPDFPTRAGRTARTRSSMPTAASLRGRSRWSRCRATSSPPIRGLPHWPRGAARTSWRRAGAAWRKRCGPRSRSISGWRSATSMRWRSTERERNARVRASNAGHLLYRRAALAGAGQARGRRNCCRSAFNSGWGMSTLADDEMPFNPMSYHNGSIWPHDTAICAAGLAAL